MWLIEVTATRSLLSFILGDGESAITEGLRTALARLRQRSTPPSPGNQSSPIHQPASTQSQQSGATDNSSNSSSPIPRPRMTVNSQSGPRSPRPPEDLIATATSALRRLNFKTGRCATKNTSKNGQGVPKVIVMGSSTASETTINTSTDSSNTIVTTMTATDGDNTEDSLDLIEPLDSILSTDNERQPNPIQPVPITPKTPPTATQQTPPTTKEKETRFLFDMESDSLDDNLIGDPFDPPLTLQQQQHLKEQKQQQHLKEQQLHLKDHQEQLREHQQHIKEQHQHGKDKAHKDKFIDLSNVQPEVQNKEEEKHHHHHHHADGELKEKSQSKHHFMNGKEDKNVDILMDEQIEALKLEGKRRNSYKAAQGNIDFDMITEKTSSRERNKKYINHHRHHNHQHHRDKSNHQNDTNDGDISPTNNGLSTKVRHGNTSTSITSSGSNRRKKCSSSGNTSNNHNNNNSGNGNSRKPNNSPSKRDKFIYDETHIAKYREKSKMVQQQQQHQQQQQQQQQSQLPDLRIDFFNETMDGCQQQLNEKRGSVCLNKCLREVGAQLEQSSLATSPINVTTNPLENSVQQQVQQQHHQQQVQVQQHYGGSCRKATIVVQQPSLSIDQQSNISTIVLKNGSEFVSNVVDSVGNNSTGTGGVSGVIVGGGVGGGVSGNNKLTLKKQKEDNMKQLLDVANNLTLEEIHDFEMRYGSPHHNRSQSVKTPGRSSGRPNYLCLPQQRSRVASMPNTGVEEEYYRLRHFSITGKGVVNRGDSLKSRRSRSNNSVASSNSSTEQLPTTAAGSARTSASCSLASSRESSTSAPGPVPYKVLMLGGPAVGKSSLVSQFMTSEYLHAYDTSIGKQLTADKYSPKVDIRRDCSPTNNVLKTVFEDDESGEKSVSVLLAGEESELTFIDFATADMSPDSCIQKYTDPHAYCVVYSSADRSSLECAERILQTLWTLDTISTRAVILVSNKADLVRSRVVTTEEGKSMATSYDCKYIETSVGINHNVDELLVGILTQIRLKLENPERTRDIFRKRSSSKRNLNRNKSPASGTATPTGSAQNSPKKYRGSRTSASLKVRNLLGKVWARDSKSKSCENLHVL